MNYQAIESLRMPIRTVNWTRSLNALYHLHRSEISAMSYAYVTKEEADALMDVTVESLAGFCGIPGGEHTDEGNIANLKRQVPSVQCDRYT